MVAPFGSQVDHPIATLDEVHMMFDHQDRITAIDQSLEDLDQLSDVGQMESGGGFVEDVEGIASGGPGEFVG